MIRIYGAPLSNFSRKVFLALEWKGVDYEMVHTRPGDSSDAFGAISPLRKIPVLEDEGYAVPDSSVILHYVDRRFPDRPLCPKEPRQAATALFVEEYIDTQTVETVGAIWLEAWLKPNFMGQPADAERLSDIENGEMPRFLTYLESCVVDGSLGGIDNPNVADFAAISSFMAGRMGGFEPDAGRYPRLSAYLDSFYASPLVQRRLEAENAYVAQMTGSAGS